MKVTVKGISIQLTDEQIQHIEKEIAAREKAYKSFDRVLKSFGFKKISTKGWANRDQNCYSHNEHGWFAEILDHGNYKTCVLHGKGLDYSDPWGKICECPEYVAKALSSALDEIENL